MQAFTLPIVGAPYANKDKSNRQFEIMLCDPGDLLQLVPEPKNPYDEHAVAVFSERGVQIGYVSSERAVQLALLLRAGRELFAVFQAATQWGAFARIGVDHIPSLPTQRTPVETPDEWGHDDPGFYPDDIPPDE
jgi:hypothetical protein